MSPFAIGFFGTVGAMVAFLLMSSLAQVQGILVIVLLSMFVALGLNPLVEAMHRRGLRRAIGVAVVSIVGLGVVALAGIAIVPVLTAQVTSLVAAAPGYLQELRANPSIADLDARFGIINRATEFLSSGALLNDVFGGILGAGRILANVVFTVIMTIVLTIYFLASLPSIKETIYRLAPASRRPRVRYLADEMMRRVGGYLSGMFVVVSIAGVCAFVFLTLSGLGEFSLALAFVVAMFAFIPLVGSTCSMVICAIVAFSVSAPQGIATVVYFLLYQQFDAYVLQPRVMGRSVDVPGAVVVLAAITGGTLLGVIGALIAIPVAAALLLLYREVLIPRLDRS